MPINRHRGQRKDGREDLRPTVVFSGKCVQVWLLGGSRPPKLVGSLDIVLALDASRHGQDLVAELLDVAARHAERATRMT